ncbi:peptidoglycan-associated lipoprotein Pal [Brevundimonas sp. BH3]|uniref:peptidoglycan-associated lipoprotein Pal n=1 Tax=unclassified Brevundimonas TaxID=2622653 RepID=UPI0028A19601|nr:peptidoglycan-associated lipoprotein Pal [Brevundimonas sp.]
MTKVSIIKVATIGAIAAAMAACTPKPPVETATPTPPPTATNPSYPTAPTGPVDGNNTGPVAGSEQDFVINVGDRIYFDLDSYEVNAEAGMRLGAQAQWLQRYPSVNIRIEGNADERGTSEYNLALGARRAESVRNFLISRGIPANRIDTISFGKERPIAEGSNEAAWAQNRNARTAIASGAPR